MRIQVLVDNNTYIDQYYFAEPGFSCLIEDEGTAILVDTGYSDLCIRNAELLGLDLQKVNTIALSHGHNDHTRGLVFLCARYPDTRFSIVGHPDVFVPRENMGTAVGSPYNQEEISRLCDVRLSRDPVRLSKNVFFLGEIPRALPFEPATSVGTRSTALGKEPDSVPDDSALVCVGKDGLFIVSGCSHVGICNIIEHAKAVTGVQRVAGVLGGFHLFETGPRVTATIDYFVRNDIQQLYPCHCVSFAVKAEIHRHIPIHEVGVGLRIEW